MYLDKRILAVIPARGGSVGVPRKNIRLLHGVPLFLHTVGLTKRVAELDLSVVSTEDREIATIARDAGIRVIDRPVEYATGTASTESVLLHALAAVEAEGPFDYVVTLEPTSPFRTPETVSKCIRLVVDGNGASLLTVRETRSSLGRLENGRFRRLDPTAARRRQDRTPLYMESSTVYVTSADHLLRYKSVVADDWLAVEVGEREAFDINTPLDFAVAEAMHEGG
jgi:CMP-N,N'-diacetyllegionaminic acid synthase